MRSSLVIVGAGMMGCSIAAVAALAGKPVVLVLHRPNQRAEARKKVLLAIDELQGYGLFTDQQCCSAKTRISLTMDIQTACASAWWVIESIDENLQHKQDLFQQLDDLLPPEIPILSNTSGLRITDIAEKMNHPERALTTHFWLPAHLIPLVEIVVGAHSSPELAKYVAEELRRWGKSPIVVNKDFPGQLANRILQAVIREATNIVESGLASAEDVDTAVKMGMGLRFPVWGPLEHVDAVGMDVCAAIQNTVLPEISASKTASPIFKSHIDSGEIGYKAGKGFYDWEKRNMHELKTQRNEFIVCALRFMKEHQFSNVSPDSKQSECGTTRKSDAT